VTIDTTAPNAPSITSVTDDVSPQTGPVSNGGSTNDTDLTVRVSLSGTNAVANDTVQLFNGASTLGSAHVLTGAEITAGFVDLQTGTLTNGTTYSLNAKVTDVAGNVSSASATFTVTEDTTAPSAPSVPDLIAASDSGSSSTDNVTNVTTPTFSGTAEAGSTVTIFSDGVAVGSGVATSGSYNITTSALSQATHSITAKATDAAGNVSLASAGLSVTIDTTAAAPSAPDMTAATDSGSSTTDNITNVTTPVFTGSGAEAGATVSLFDTNGTTVLGTAVANSSGNWSITSSALASGGHTLTAKETDIAGNTSVASASLAVTIDTTAPLVAKTGFTGHTVSGTDSDTGGSGVATVFVSDTTSGVSGNATLGSGTWSYSNGNNVSNKDNLTITATDVAGNQTTISDTAPAGVSGTPINLGLTDYSADHVGATTVTLAGIPSGWTLSEGTTNSDGTWTVVTNDVASLSVTSLANYTGALVLNVSETWTNADGTTGSAIVADNVEAYAAGSPIFALSGDDTLTASSGHDLLVFSQPIGHDTVYNFDVAADQIDLVGYAGFTSFADVQAHTADDVAGNAVITLGDGQTITLHGVDAGSLTDSDFVFDQTPVTENAGTMTIGDGAILPLSGIIDNTGTIALNSTGSETDLQLIEHGITLEGGGQVILSDSAENVITGTVSDVTLTNVDNTISGAGHLGDGVMILINQGTIIATGTNALEINTGTNTVSNSGTLEATGSGGLIIDSNVDNSGLLWAHGANITLNGSVTGSGSALMDGVATVEFGAASTANVALDAAATGTIVLHDSFDFSGVVSGFNGDDHLDLLNLAFGAGTTASYAANQAGTGGTLSVTDGVHTANITLLGQYDPAGFQTEADKTTGTLISYHHLA
jgi:hypothetical protein